MNKGCSQPIIFNHLSLTQLLQLHKSQEKKIILACFIFFLLACWKKFLLLQCIWIFVVKFIDDGSKIKTWAVITHYQQVELYNDIFFYHCVWWVFFIHVGLGWVDPVGIWMYQPSEHYQMRSFSWMIISHLVISIAKPAYGVMCVLKEWKCWAFRNSSNYYTLL